MAKGDRIGLVGCPLCKRSCRVTLDTRDKPYWYCADCGCKTTIAYEEGVELLRKQMTALKGAPSPAPAPANDQPKKENKPHAEPGRGGIKLPWQ